MRNQQQKQQVAGSNDTLGDVALAKQRLEQAQKMEREANGLLAESKRLLEEAQQLDPSLAPASPSADSGLSMTPSAIRSRAAKAKAKATREAAVNT